MLINIFHRGGIPPDENKSIKIIKGGVVDIIRGTYVHPLLIPHIASWISPEFAIKVSEIVNYHLTMQLRNHNTELMKKIDDQTKQMKLQHEESQRKINELLGYAKDTSNKLQETNELVTEKSGIT